jgi:hypothetical protein
MKLLEQVKSKIQNHKDTLSVLLVVEEKTEWHKKQISNLLDMIKELEWVISDGEDEKLSVCETADNLSAHLFLKVGGVYQKDEQGLYSYVSDNGKHLVNLTALLEDYKKYLYAVNLFANNSKQKDGGN